MCRRLFFSLFALAAFLPAILAQAPKEKDKEDPTAPKDEFIETIDGVKLRCRFYRAQAEGNGACVLMMHEYGKDPNKGDWDGLARKLADTGFNVLRFDFRGHGQSTEVIPLKFWEERANFDYVMGSSKTPPPSNINFDKSKPGKGFKDDYFPYLINDLAAARNALDLKNDNGLVNTRSVYIIAPGNVAGLALLFLSTEWHRDQVKPLQTGALGVGAAAPQIVSNNRSHSADIEMAGKDYAGLILLSPMRQSQMKLSDSLLMRCVSSIGRDSTGDMRKETPLLVVYGRKTKDDKSSKDYKDATFFYENVFASSGKSSPRLEKLEYSLLEPIVGTDLKGVDLLGKDDTLHTESTIIKHMMAMETQRKKPNPIKRGYDRPLRIALSTFMDLQ